MPATSHAENGRVIHGEFHSDGETFIFTLADTPLSGVGNTPQAAFDDLIRVTEQAGALPERLRDLAREQAGAAERASLIRLVGALLIGLTIAGGALGGAAVLAPRVVADVIDTINAKQQEPA
ncbi:MAG: hypothetical protein ACK4M6_05410 [Hyphomonas sp.]